MRKVVTARFKNFGSQDYLKGGFYPLLLEVNANPWTRWRHKWEKSSEIVIVMPTERHYISWADFYTEWEIEHHE